MTPKELYPSLVQMIIHAESITWSRFYNFLMFNTILILSWATVWVPATAPQSRPVVLAAICILGGISGIFWAALGYRGRAFLSAFMTMAKEFEADSAVWTKELDAAGLVQSLARPGTNVTGLTNLTAATLLPKRVELLLETAPRISRLAHLLEDADPASRSRDEPAARTAAEAKGLKISAVFLRGREDVARAFAEIEKLRPDGLIVAAGGLTGSIRREIALEARRLRLPAISGLSTYVDDGLLMSYGVNAHAAFRYGVKYIDRILKGAKPGELPVEQARTFEFVVNLKTAREIGITIPQSILLRADRVIE